MSLLGTPQGVSPGYTVELQQQLPQAPHGRLPVANVTIVAGDNYRVGAAENERRASVPNINLSKLYPSAHGPSRATDQARDRANARDVSEMLPVTKYRELDPTTAALSRAAQAAYPVKRGLRGAVIR